MQAQDLTDPVVEPLVVPVERSEPSDIDCCEVAGRLTGNDPLGQRPSGSAARGDPHRVEPGPDEEVRQLRGLAQDELVIGGEAFGAVVELTDPRVLQGRNSLDCALHEDREVIPVLVEELELERIRKLVGRDPRLRLRFESADHQAPHLFFEVGVAIRVPKDWEIGVHSIDLLGDHIEVLR